MGTGETAWQDSADTFAALCDPHANGIYRKAVREDVDGSSNPTTASQTTTPYVTTVTDT